MLRNLVSRNPGFEGETWQTILHCKSVTSNSCTDDNPYASWPANFLAGGTAEFIYGNATGSTASVTASTAASTSALTGVTVTFGSLSAAISAGDYVVIRLAIPGNPLAGWWTSVSGAATFAVEYSDLYPGTAGKQALRINASTSGQSAVLSSFFDTTSGHTFLQLQGSYTLSFKAKGTGGNDQVALTLTRLSSSGKNTVYLNQTQNLSTSWQQYNVTFTVNDVAQNEDMQLAFTAAGASLLLDDVSLTPTNAASGNPTAFRDEVVSTLKTLHPGVLRYMDSGTNWGSTLANLLTPQFGRSRAGYSPYGTEQDDIAVGLHDFLVLCQTVGAEPWYTMQTGMTKQEMSDLMDYLGGSTSTPYGALRASLGQTEPWTTVFPTIHLEFGNEVWNTSNPGATMTDATAYGTRAGAIFAVAKASPSYSASKFDLVLDGWAAVPYWTTQALAASSNYDTVDAAPYLFYTFNNYSSIENVFGPMFAQPELFDSSTGTGIMEQTAQAAASAARPAKVAIYETGLSTISGSAPQQAVASVVPSLGAGLASVEHMFLMMREEGIVTQNMFALSGYQAGFSGGSSGETTPLWGAVVDMGNTNRVRPELLAEQLANSAILPTLLTTTQSGDNPTWNQATSTNDNIALTGAHYIQAFGFTNGTADSVVIFNLHRTQALPVSLVGAGAPTGNVTISTLTSTNITDNNESASNVAITSATQTLAAGQVWTLPPYSMTVISSSVASAAAIAISSVAATCSPTSLYVSSTTSCVGTVSGTGNYSPALAWKAQYGTVSSSGVYTAPATAAASLVDTITATSLQDSTKSTTTSVVVMPTPTVTGLTVTCTPTPMAVSSQGTCKAAVTGTGAYSSAVTWSTTAGTIDQNGVVTTPSTQTAFTVKAVSQANTSISSSVSVPMGVVPKLSGLNITTTSTSITVSWTSSPSAYNGVNYGLTASLGSTTAWVNTATATPSFTISGLTPGTLYYIGAWSINADPASGGQAAGAVGTLGTTAITNASTIASVTSTCGATGLLTGASTTCTSTVAGTGNFSSLINWSTNLGSITSSGVYTAPATLTAAATATVTATSAQDGSKYATTTIAITPATTITGVAVNCAATSLFISTSTTCASTVTGTGSFSSGVTWKASVGSITTAGAYTAPPTVPTGGTVVITATSTQDTTKSTTQTLTVAAPSITAVALSCTPTSLAPKATANCTPSVTGAGAFSSGVSYSANYGSISAAGVYTAPATAPAAAVVITATSTQDTTKSGSANITVVGPAITAVAVSCTPTSVAINATTTCTSSVTGTGAFTSTVTWSANYGSITSAGVYTAPSTVPAAAVVITATSTQDTTKSGSATVTVAPPTITAVALSCTPTSVQVNAIANCSVSVTGTGAFSSAVTYTANYGNISSAGTYTAPSTVPAAAVTITATSTQDKTKSASQTLTIAAASTGPVISCTPSALLTGSTAVCAATLNGVSSSSAYTWAVSAGSMDAWGTLYVPSTGTSITVTATSKTTPAVTGTLVLPISSSIVMSPVTVSGLTATSATLSWTTNAAVKAGVNYGTTTKYGSTTPTMSAASTSETFTLTGLTAGTTYYINVWATGGNQYASATLTFTTPAE